MSVNLGIHVLCSPPGSVIKEVDLQRLYEILKVSLEGANEKTARWGPCAFWCWRSREVSNH